MGLHKIIEEGGEQYLPFALSRMRQLQVEADANFGVANRVIWADDGARIRLSISLGEQHLHITGGGVKYQFASSGEFLRSSPYGALGFDYDHGYAVEVSKKGGALKAVPLGSTVKADTEDPKRWKFSDDPQDISGMFSVQNVWQINFIPEHTYYPSKKDAKGSVSTGAEAYPALLSTWSASNQLTGMLSHSGLPDTLFNSIDVAYDASPALFRSRATREPLGKIGIAPDADWYRRAAIHTAKSDEFGSRQFIVMVDVSNKFHIYPTSAPIDATLYDGAPPQYKLQAIKTNVSSAFVQVINAPLPLWAKTAKYTSRDSALDPTDAAATVQYLADVPQYVWEFDGVGKNACAIVYERLAQPEMSDDEFPVLDGQPSNGEPLAEALPGLLEVSIVITLTGDKPQDFTAAVVSKRAFRPSVDKRYFVAAGYSWRVPAAAPPPPQERPPNLADVDDLIVVTGHVYHTSSERERLGSWVSDPYTKVAFNPYAAKGVLRVQNLTKSTVVRTFLVYGNYQRYLSPMFQGDDTDWLDGRPAYELFARLLAYDLRILAFAFEQGYIERDFTYSINYGYLLNSTSQAKRTQVYAFNQLEESKLLDLDSPLNTALEVAYSDTSTLGLFEYSVADVGEFNMTYSVAPLVGRAPEQSFYSMLGAFPLYAPLLIDNTGYRTHDSNGQYLPEIGQYHAGAVLYGQLILPSIGPGPTSPRDSFTVHPSGSWSVSSMPIVYFAGPASRRIGADIDPAMLRQGRIDVICYRNGGKSIKTTHRACFNEAYGAHTSEQDFLYEFSKETSTTPNGNFLTFLRISATADPEAPLAPYYQMFVPVATTTSYSSYIAPVDPFCIDLRRPSSAYSTQPQIYELNPANPAAGYVRGPAEAQQLTRKTPFTRGSSLFF